MTDATFTAGLLAAKPRLTTFAMRLTHNPDRAEDLVAETLCRGWKHRGRFIPGSNINAWLCTILRNVFLTELRRKRWDGGYVEDLVGHEPASLGAQEDCVHLRDLEAALAILPRDQREAVLAVALAGDYEDAALALSVPVGTIKSRVGRGRRALQDMTT